PDRPQPAQGDGGRGPGRHHRPADRRGPGRPPGLAGGLVSQTLVQAWNAAKARLQAAGGDGPEPVSHILGRKGFWKIMLQVTADVLTPRPDTETLVELVLLDLPEAKAFSVLDLGVGS